MSCSPEQLAANRANAPLSSGKMSDQGRAAVRLNACKHGLTAKQTILPNEDSGEFQRLRASLFSEHEPANVQEELLVEEIAANYWRLLRARKVESALFEESFQTASGDAALAAAFTLRAREFENVRRYITSIERAWHKALEALNDRQTERLVAEAQQPNGTVSQDGDPIAAEPSPRSFVQFRSMMERYIEDGETDGDEPELAPNASKPAA